MLTKTKLLLLVLFAQLLPLASFAYDDDEWGDLNNHYNVRKPQEIRAENLPAQQPRAPIHVNRLDQEILILRAELAKRRGDAQALKHYLSVLKRQYILPEFKDRVAALDSFKDQSPSAVSKFLSFFSSAASIDFPLNDSNAVVAIVLPTSDEYAVAGEPLQEALRVGLTQAGFQGKLVAMDSAIYDSAADIWGVLKYYQPDFIFGPLQKNMVQQWQQLSTGVPTFYFNELAHSTANEYALSPSKQSGMEQIFQVISDSQFERLLVVVSEQQSAQNLETDFQQAWLNFAPANHYSRKIIEKNVGKTLDKGLNVHKSKARHLWLNKALQTSLEFTPRVRQDIEAVVSFVPQSQAIQISPYLHFLPFKQNVSHIWYPSKTPAWDYLQKNIDAWQQTFAILPIYSGIESTNRKVKFQQEPKSGLFYALGRVAIEIVKNPSLSQSVDSLVETEYGTYVRNSNGQFNLLPVVYWADKGVFERFVSQSE